MPARFNAALSMLALLSGAAPAWAGAACGDPALEAGVRAAREGHAAAREAYRLCQQRHSGDWPYACESAFLADQQASRAYAALLLSGGCATSARAGAAVPGRGEGAARLAADGPGR